MPTPDEEMTTRLQWLREVAETPTAPEMIRARALALEEHYHRNRDLGWPPAEAWHRAHRRALAIYPDEEM